MNDLKYKIIHMESNVKLDINEKGTKLIQSYIEE